MSEVIRFLLRLIYRRQAIEPAPGPEAIGAYPCTY